MKVKNNFYCDCCGSLINGDEVYFSDLKMSVDFSDYDACWGGSGIEKLQIENKLREVSENEWNEVLDTYLAHKKIDICMDCVNDPDSVVREFETNIRNKRATILYDLLQKKGSLLNKEIKGVGKKKGSYNASCQCMNCGENWEQIVHNKNDFVISGPIQFDRCSECDKE